MNNEGISKKKVTPRLFESNFMEAMSKIHWTVPLYIFIPAILFFLYYSYTVKNIAIAEIIPFFLVGVLFWTILEYVIHRFLFHYEAKSETGKRLIFIFHGIHHTYPNDPLRLVMPPSVSIPLGVFFFYIFQLIFGQHFFTAPFAGLLAGYLAYDMTHYATHHFAIKNKWLKKVKTLHMLHHFKNHEHGYGVSSPLWDYIFGTIEKS